MESRRQQKVSRFLQRELGEIFLQNGKRLFNNSFITITDVQVSPDLLEAKAYVNVLQEDDPKGLVARINENVKEIRNLLGQRVRHQMRRIPNLEFFYDDSLDKAERMDEIFEKIHKNEDTRENRDKLG